MNKKIYYLIKILLVVSHGLLSTNVSEAIDELEQEIKTFRTLFSNGRLRIGRYDEEKSIANNDLSMVVKNNVHAFKYFFNFLVSNGNYEESFRSSVVVPSRILNGPLCWCDMPQSHIDVYKNNTKSYILTQSPLIFEKLLSSHQYIKAYKFSIAYRDVFSMVYAENAATIRIDVDGWLTQIKTQTTKKIEEFANTFSALSGRGALQEIYGLKGIALIAAFPEGDPIRIHLQAHFDAIRRSPLPAVQDEEMVRLKIYRDMANQLFPEGG